MQHDTEADAATDRALCNEMDDASFRPACHTVARAFGLHNVDTLLAQAPELLCASMDQCSDAVDEVGLFDDVDALLEDDEDFDDEEEEDEHDDDDLDFDFFDLLDEQPEDSSDAAWLAAEQQADALSGGGRFQQSSQSSFPSYSSHGRNAFNPATWSPGRRASCGTEGQGSSCINTNSQGCNGVLTTGLCPGPANIKCCFTRPRGGDQCHQGGGRCQSTHVACNGRWAHFHCPGSHAVKCCYQQSPPPPPPPAPTPPPPAPKPKPPAPPPPLTDINAVIKHRQMLAMQTMQQAMQQMQMMRMRMMSIMSSNREMKARLHHMLRHVPGNCDCCRACPPPPIFASRTSGSGTKGAGDQESLPDGKGPE